MRSDMAPSTATANRLPLRNARYLEGLTPLLVAVNKRYKVHASIRIAGLRRDGP
jgi:hypothetical protein